MALIALATASMPASAGWIVIKGSDLLGAKFVPQLAEAFSWFTEGFDTADLIEAKELLARLN